jgi:hypothetical protein
VTRKLRNITRLDHGRTHGWWVRFQRALKPNGSRAVVSKCFSDGLLGGKRKALAAAMAWRDRTARKLPPPNPSRHDDFRPGYGYVKRYLLKRRVGYSWVWMAWVRLEGRRAASTSVSIERWGEREAKRRAEAYLARKRGALRGGRP